MPVHDGAGMLRWSGDYTLPRLRAKLAGNTSGFEPDYAEVYRPELGQSTIFRRDSPDFFAAMRDSGCLDSLSRTGSLGGLTKGSNTVSGSSWVSSTSRNGASLSTARSSQAFDQMHSSMRSTDSLGKSMMSRTSSVPSLGSRRISFAPAAMSTLPPGWLSPSATTQPGLGTTEKKAYARPIHVPTNPDEIRALEKEKLAEAASKKLWSAAGGGELYVKQWYTVYRDEDPNQSNQVLLGKMSKSQIPGMNKAMKAGAKIDYQNKEWDGATLLIKSVRSGAMHMAIYCLSLGADVALTDESGRGVLHWSAIAGDAKMLGYFLKEYPDLSIDAKDCGGDSPLHLAAYNGHLGCVKLLCGSGAHHETPNAGSFTPEKLAEARRMWHVAGYLRDHSAEDAEPSDDKEGGNDKEEHFREKTGAQGRLVRPCNLARANELLRVGLLDP